MRPTTASSSPTRSTKRDGRVIEEIGKYHPTEEPSFIEVDSERAQYWLERRRTADRAGRRAAQADRRLGQVQGRRERRVDRSHQGEPKEPFQIDAAKKLVLKPKAEKKAEEPVVEAEVEAAAADADSTEA